MRFTETNAKDIKTCNHPCDMLSCHCFICNRLRFSYGEFQGPRFTSLERIGKEIFCTKKTQSMPSGLCYSFGMSICFSYLFRVVSCLISFRWSSKSRKNNVNVSPVRTKEDAQAGTGATVAKGVIYLVKFLEMYVIASHHVFSIVTDRRLLGRLAGCRVGHPDRTHHFNQRET